MSDKFDQNSHTTGLKTNPLYARLQLGAKLYVKVTDRDETWETAWAYSMGPASCEYDTFEKACESMRICTYHIRTMPEIYKYKITTSCDEPYYLQSQLQNYQRAIETYMSFLGSGEKSHNTLGQICFAGGVEAGTDETGFLWYSCSDKKVKFRLDANSSETVEEITEEEYMMQVVKHAKFTKVMERLWSNGHPYNNKQTEVTRLMAENAESNLAEYEANDSRIDVLEEESKEILVKALDEVGF